MDNQNKNKIQIIEHDWELLEEDSNIDLEFEKANVLWLCELISKLDKENQELHKTNAKLNAHLAHLENMFGAHRPD